MSNTPSAESSVRELPGGKAARNRSPSPGEACLSGGKSYCSEYSKSGWRVHLSVLGVDEARELSRMRLRLCRLQSGALLNMCSPSPSGHSSSVAGFMSTQNANRRIFK